MDEIWICETNWRFACENILKNINETVICYKVFITIDEVKRNLWELIAEEVNKKRYYRWKCKWWICENCNKK